uniref:ATP synthase CF0 B' subunit n=1 Tax=Mallomonas splendens TaxID=52552 RepID=A0A3G2QZX4_9STRA|nr:ATP synthase CF0 B' subunit [Mallomonas splendens]AYO28512.1 ATP synthase CF0 B' subunit [Mallomonas splendens]
MIFSETFLLNGGLFDFDFTFIIETFEFLILSIVVTFGFLSPLSKHLDERAESLNITLRKSTILLTLGYENLINCIDLINSEINELVRQTKLVNNYSNEKFENQILVVQKENNKILTKLKGELSIKSAYVFSKTTNELNSLTNTFFIKKFKL